jgi:two-component system, chemotaxis family, chemotaxis protein CheY
MEDSVRVLIVDDSTVMRMIVGQALVAAELPIEEVVNAANGAQALLVLEADAAARRSFDLILTDIHMPVMDGLQLLIERRARKLAAGVPTIVLTADAGDPKVVEAIAAGAMGYLLKPFTLQQMRDSIAAVLQQPV